MILLPLTFNFIFGTMPTLHNNLFLGFLTEKVAIQHQINLFVFLSHTSKDFNQFWTGMEPCMHYRPSMGSKK